MLQIAEHEGEFIVYHSATKKTLARFDTYDQAIQFIRTKP